MINRESITFFVSRGWWHFPMRINCFIYTCKMEFDKDKSHLSDLKKVEFESNTTSISSILEIPGIGEKTQKALAIKHIYTIDDLVNSIENDFKKLHLLTPSKVNNHTIFDALESYRDTMKEEVNETNSGNIEELLKIQKMYYTQMFNSIKMFTRF